MRVVLIAIVAISCARSELRLPVSGGLCANDDDCARNQRCVDGACLGCEAPPEVDPCAGGPCYYIAPSGGSDDATGTSAQEPWDSFDHAWSVLQPGDTLVLLDGVYTAELHVRVSGAPGAPIIIRALNDGGAVIDGELVRVPCRVADVSHVTLEGFHCRNIDALADNGGVLFFGNANHITARRMTVSGANPDTALVHVYRSADILVEDTAAWSQSSDNVFGTYGGDRITFRRCWGELPENGVESVRSVALQMTEDSRVENCVAMAPTSVNGYSPYGIIVSTSDNERSIGNQLIGNVNVESPGWAYWFASHGEIMRGTRLRDNVAIRPGWGTFQRADNDLIIDRHTQVGTINSTLSLGAIDAWPYVPEFAINGEVVNSVFVGGSRGFSASTWAGIVPTLTHDFNVLFGVTTPYDNGVDPGTHEQVDTVEPVFDTNRYGDGAYLLPPTNLASAGEGGGRVGAEVLYRTVDGDLTCVPLWPWPMEGRIRAERGISVTWERDGGLWKTLDGVYP